jgi:S1-C subfamily serine protease
MQRLIITCTLLILAAAGGAYAGFASGISRLERFAASAEQANGALSSRLSDLESTVLLLAAETGDIRTGVAFYTETYTTEKQALSDALEKLSGTVSEQKDELTLLYQSSDISGIITTWSPYVYDITCSFKKGAETSQGGGSAVLEYSGGATRFITNRHVVETEGYALVNCKLVQPKNDVTITVDDTDIVLSDNNDFAYGVLTSPITAMNPSKRCATAPAIGDSVVMLGYPQIGARESVTATEGIISGFDEKHYTTSAKIEKGNSGGAAIDVKRNCFLGLPTLVFAGRIESLARILPVASLQ